MVARTQLAVSALEDRSLLSSYYSYTVSGSNFDYEVTGMPDFDQRRQANATVDGLPGNGGMYCGPTAATNIMAFLANRGHPSLMPFVGAKVWQTADYDTVTAEIGLMGDMMDTHATDGTTGKGMVAGLKGWLTALAPDKFDVYAGSASTGNSLADGMAFFGACGGLVIPVYGRYTTADNMNYTRSGGHLLTLTDLSGRFGQFEPKTIGWRDPARYGSEGENKFTQSTFDTDTYTLTGVSATFDGKTKYLERVNGLGTNTFIDGYFAVVPRSGTTVLSFDTAALANIVTNLPFGGGGDGDAAGPAIDASVWVVPPAVNAPTIAPPATGHDELAPVAVTPPAESDDSDELDALCGGVRVDVADRVLADAEW